MVSRGPSLITKQQSATLADIKLSRWQRYERRTEGIILHAWLDWTDKTRKEMSTFLNLPVALAIQCEVELIRATAQKHVNAREPGEPRMLHVNV